MTCVVAANSLCCYAAVVLCPCICGLAPVVGIGVNWRTLAGLLMLSVMRAGACLLGRCDAASGSGLSPLSPVVCGGVYGFAIARLLDGGVLRAHSFFLSWCGACWIRCFSPFSVPMPIRYHYVNPRSRCAGNLHDFVANSGYRDTASYYVIKFIKVIALSCRIGYRLHRFTLRNIHVYMAIRIYCSARCRHVHAANELDEMCRFKVSIQTGNRTIEFVKVVFFNLCSARWLGVPAVKDRTKCSVSSPPRLLAESLSNIIIIRIIVIVEGYGHRRILIIRVFAAIIVEGNTAFFHL